MKKYKKRLALLLVAATILSVIAGSLAYFTDRVTGSTAAVAGNLKLSVSEPVVSSNSNMKPGTAASVSFTLTNNGNKSADVLETLVLTVKDSKGTALPMSATSEFDLYLADDVTIANGIATVKDGKSPLTVRSHPTGSNQITYAIPQFILNGTGDGAETETGITSNAKASSYVLLFRGTAGNAFQGATVTLDYEAQAKQHRNTNDSTWTLIKSETITFAGNDAHAAVPTAPAS